MNSTTAPHLPFAAASHHVLDEPTSALQQPEWQLCALHQLALSVEMWDFKEKSQSGWTCRHWSAIFFIVDC